MDTVSDLPVEAWAIEKSALINRGWSYLFPTSQVVEGIGSNRLTGNLDEIIDMVDDAIK